MLQSYVWAQFIPSAYFASEHETVMSVVRWVGSEELLRGPARIIKPLPFFEGDTFILEADGFRGQVELYSQGRYVGALRGSGRITLLRRWCGDKLELVFSSLADTWAFEGAIYFHARGLVEREPIWRFPEPRREGLRDTYVDWIGWDKNLHVWRLPYQWAFPSVPPRPLRALIACGQGMWKVGLPPPAPKSFSLLYFLPFLVGVLSILLDQPLGYGLASGVVGFFLGQEIGKPMGFFILLAVGVGYLFARTERDGLLKGWLVGGLVSWGLWLFWQNPMGIWGSWLGIRLVWGRSAKILYLCLLETAILFLLRWL
ncbi:MAG: hypothetical protein ACUVRD_01955 [Bacteroidia bacterium]